jgi:hypothetical protein
VWARVARFEGDPADVDARIGRLRSAFDSGTLASQLPDARFLLLVDRPSGAMLGVGLFDTEEAMREADAVMNAGPGNAGSRSAENLLLIRELHAGFGGVRPGMRRCGRQGLLWYWLTLVAKAW